MSPPYSSRSTGLRDAKLQDAVVYEANFGDAVLRNTQQAGAKFYRATLDRVNLQGATYDVKTLWPDTCRTPMLRMSNRHEGKIE